MCIVQYAMLVYSLRWKKHAIHQWLGLSFSPNSLLWKRSRQTYFSEHVEVMAASYQIAPHEPFNFSCPKEWTKWRDTGHLYDGSERGRDLLIVWNVRWRQGLQKSQREVRFTLHPEKERTSCWNDLNTPTSKGWRIWILKINIIIVFSYSTSLHNIEMVVNKVGMAKKLKSSREYSLQN